MTRADIALAPWPGSKSGPSRPRVILLGTLTGRTAVKVVAETDDVLAFHHTRPYWPVHIVVIPKAHVPSLTDLGGHDESVVQKVLSVVRQVAASVEADRGACRVLTNLGDYQDSKHLHFHINWGRPLR